MMRFPLRWRGVHRLAQPLVRVLGVLLPLAWGGHGWTQVGPAAPGDAASTPEEAAPQEPEVLDDQAASPSSEDETAGDAHFEPIELDPNDPAEGSQLDPFELEEIVLTATRTPKLRLDTAVPVDVVTEEQLAEKMPTSVEAAIADVPGVTLYNHGGVYFQNPTIRGLNGRRVSMLVDGDRINSEKTMGVTAYFLSIEDLRRIEVIRGPTSVLHGTDGLGGAVNVLTKDPFDKQGFSGHAGFSMATNNLEFVEKLRVAYATDTWYASLSGRLRDADNYSSGDATLDNSFYHDADARAELGLKHGKHELRLGALHHLSRDIGKAADALDDEKNRRIYFPTDDVSRVTLRYLGNQLGTVLQSAQASVFYEYVDRQNVARIFRDPGTWRDASIRTDKLAAIHHTGAQSALTLLLGSSHILSTGVSAGFKSVDIFSDSTSFMPPPLEPFSSPRVVDFDDARELAFGVFVQDEWSPFSLLDVSLGIRFDLIEGWNTPQLTQALPDPSEMNSRDYAMSGNLGLVFHTSEHTRITANLGRAFRAASMNEKYLTTTTCLGVYCGAESLHPEKSLNADLGFKGVIGPLLIEVHAFNTLVDDLITAEPQGENQECDYRYTNTAKAWLWGGEARLALSLELVPNWSLEPFVSASYVWAQDRQSEEPLAQVPPLEGNGGLRLQADISTWLRSFYVEAKAGYHAAQQRVAAYRDETGARVESEQPSEDYLLLGASAGVFLDAFWFFDSARLSINAENLANAAFRDHLSSTQGMGRNLKLGLSLSF